MNSRISVSAARPSPLPLLALLLLSATALAACARTPEVAATAAVATSGPAATPAQATVAAAPKQQALPLMVVHKSPSCGCCGSWIEHMQKAGFKVETRNVDDMGPVKARVGVPFAKGSCHTAEVGGYFIEGHVPAEDVKRLLAEHPDARGLTVPGMPAGSPGMELPDGSVQPYVVELVARDGTTSVFARHGQ
jgi:hypothetical protein